MMSRFEKELPVADFAAGGYVRNSQTGHGAVSGVNDAEMMIEVGATRAGKRVSVSSPVCDAGGVMVVVAGIDACATLRELCRTQVDNVTEKHE